MADTDPLVTAPPVATTVKSPVPRDPGRDPPRAVPSPAETRSRPTLEYLRDREHVLGHQRWLSRSTSWSESVLRRAGTRSFRGVWSERSGDVRDLAASGLDLVAGVGDGVGGFHGRPGGDALVERGLAEHGAQVVDGGREG